MNNAFLNKKPEKVAADVWEIVVEAWENGLSDNEAAFRVQKLLGVDLKAKEIREWCKEYPEVGELRACLQNDLLTTTKLVIADTLRDRNNKECIKTARWYAERKGADEFSTKQAVAFEGAVVELSLEEKERKLQELVENAMKDGE
ncbi:MAG: hypothetical protein IIZ78_12130 [Clostridiales bacterium]|nr:hypothetical protein [Clostridiales bacterium]